MKTLVGKRKLKSYDVVDEALTFFKQYMAENNIDLVTFFQEMDDDGSMAVSYDEFREGLKVSGSKAIQCVILTVGRGRVGCRLFCQ